MRSEGEPQGPARGQGRAPWDKSRTRTSAGPGRTGGEDNAEQVAPRICQRAARACTSAPSKRGARESPPRGRPTPEPPHLSAGIK
eukprot:4899492-Pyramimonas_sp.AAC.1